MELEESYSTKHDYIELELVFLPARPKSISGKAHSFQRQTCPTTKTSLQH